jgi:biopolymer transport protein ExbD
MMAFGGLNESDESRPMAQINMIPLIDVMLVLLIIFIITAPLITHSVRINLPQASASVNPEKPEKVTLSIDDQGEMYWNNSLIDMARLQDNLVQTAHRKPQPVLQLRAEKTTQYQRLAEVMAAAQRAGIEKMGFVTEPIRN